MVIVQLTNGFGNNLFQYIAGKLLAEFHQQELVCKPFDPSYYALNDLKNLNVPIYTSNFPGSLNIDFKEVFVDESNYLDMFNSKYTNRSFCLKGYFEDNNFYKHHIQKIRSWFPPVTSYNTNDLVLHLRAGDRLFYKNEFQSKPKANSFVNAINRFKFEKLYIVTDMPIWSCINVKQLSEMSFHIKPTNDEESVDTNLAVEYFNSIVTALDVFNPILHKGSVLEDFNFIRGFDKILFQHGTMAWWAARLSDATQVGVYRGWRKWKSNNKNLSDLELDNWFQWN